MQIGCHLPNQGPLATGDAVVTFAREAEKRPLTLRAAACGAWSRRACTH